MKVLKVLVITVVAIFLTGCYTQLQLAESGDAKKDSYTESSNASHGTQDYIYKNNMLFYSNDYNYGRYWGDSIYYTPEFYDSYWYHYGSGVSYSYLYSRLYFGPDFYGTRFTFATSPLSPFHYRYYDPFAYRGYGYHYDFYWSRYHSPFTYNYYQFYVNNGPGIYYNKDKKDQKVRYGLRSIGADRVATNVNRSRDSRNISRGSTAVNSSRSKARVRSSVGSSRTRGTINRNSASSVSRNRSRGTVTNSSSTESRTRSRGDVKKEDRSRQASNGILRVRSLELTNSLERVSENKSGTEQRLRKATGADLSENIRNNNPTFFNKMKGYFKRTGKRISNNVGSSRSSFGIHSRSTNNNRSTIRRSTNNSSSRSTVNRSRSSSSSSKSRSGGSSSSRSRGGNNGDSSSSDRNRGNN